MKLELLEFDCGQRSLLGGDLGPADEHGGFFQGGEHAELLGSGA